MKLYDISMGLKKEMIIYPNNPEFKIEQIKFIPKNSTNESLISLGTHTGTHIDAPRHIDNKGKTVNELPLNSLIGKCRVLDLTYVDFEITLEDLKKFRIKKGEMVLFKTKNSLGEFNRFNENYVHVGLDAARYLALKKVKCIGTDYLSIQKFHSGTQEVHRILLLNDIVIIEGLDLGKIKAGNYELICLPLNLIDTDGAPARAVLVKR